MISGRLNWNDYFMNIAVQVSLRSTCTRRKVGALIVKDNNIVSTGYNGAPKGLPNCSDNPNRCYRSKHNIPSGEKLELCYAQHAEVNALMSSAKAGADLTGASIYVTTFPCSSCAKAIIQAGIKHVYFIDNYSHEFTKMMFDEAGVEYIAMDGSVYNTPSIEGASVTTVNDLDVIDPLVKEIYKFTPGTKEFLVNREKIMLENGLYEKYDEMILSTRWTPDEEIVPFDRFGKINGEEIDKLLDVKYKNRNMLEYMGNGVKQIVVCGVIYDPIEQGFVLLKSIEGRLKGKCNLVQGHASVLDFEEGEIVTLHKELAKNMLRELEEEVKGIEDPHISPMCIIQTSDNKISSEHLGVCYMIIGRVDFEELKSGEPDKHEAIFVSAQDIELDAWQNDMDTWCRKIINNVLHPDKVKECLNDK